MYYNIVSVLCFVFLATGQWVHSSPSVLGGEVLTTGLPGKSQTMWSFTLLLTWRTTYTFKCKVLGSSQHSGHASLGKLSFPHLLRWFSRDTAKGFPGGPVVTTCLQLTTSSILNLCRSAFCFSGCSVPCHFRPFLCLSVEGCFMLKGFFMLHLLLTFPPHPSFPKELYISCREKYYILVQNSHVPKSNSDFFLSSIHPSAESVFPSGWIKTALSFAPLVQYSPPLSSHAHQGLSQKLRSHPLPSPSAAIRADNQNEKMPPKPAGTLWLLFAPTCFLSRASLHPDLSQSPISAPWPHHVPFHPFSAQQPVAMSSQWKSYHSCA